MANNEDPARSNPWIRGDAAGRPPRRSVSLPCRPSPAASSFMRRRRIRDDPNSGRIDDPELPGMKERYRRALKAMLEKRARDDVKRSNQKPEQARLVPPASSSTPGQYHPAESGSSIRSGWDHHIVR